MAIVSVEERIVFVGLARVTDGALLASIFVDSKMASQEKQQFERQFLQACQAQRGITNPDFRTRTTLEYPCQGNMFVMAGRDLSSHCLYSIGIRDSAYPERLAYACLGEVLERVHMTQGDSLHHLSSLSLTKPLKKPIREIIKRYQLADRDKTFEVQCHSLFVDIRRFLMIKLSGKVEELKENMQDNVRRILETHHNLENLEQRTDNMSRQADQFLKQSVDLRRAIQWRNMKLKMIMAGMAGAFLLYIVAMVAG